VEGWGEEEGGWLMVKQAKVCFVLPLWEAIAHFTHQDSRPTETEVGGSAYGNTHSSIDVSKKPPVRVSLISWQEGQKVSSTKFSLLCRGVRPLIPQTEKNDDIVRGRPKDTSFFFMFMGC
jgi:hypothetical protein